MTPAEKLLQDLKKKCSYFMVEWDMDKFTVVGVVTELLQDIVWNGDPVEVDEDEEDEDM
jgi:ABC-type uncharacterized transport system ATPase subunit